MLKKVAAAIKENRRLMRWLTSRPSTIVGIDIGSCFVKAVEISFSKISFSNGNRLRKPVLKAAGIANIPEGLVKDGQILNITALAEVLDKLWKDNRLTCRDVVAAIDGSSAFVREIVFPPMSPEEIKEAVKWNEKEYIPYEPDSYYYDFAVINQGSSGGDVSDSSECRVLLAAAQFKMVDALVALLKMSNLRVWAIDIEHLAAKLTFADCADGVVLDIGGTRSKIIVFSKGVPVTVRVIPIGGEKFAKISITEPEFDFVGAKKFKLRPEELEFELKNQQFLGKLPYLELKTKNFAKDLAGEVRRTIEYYFIRKPQVEYIYLTGGGAGLKNLAENMSTELGQVSVKVHNPLESVEISPLLDREYLNSAAPQFTVAIGLALSGGMYD